MASSISALSGQPGPSPQGSKVLTAKRPKARERGTLVMEKLVVSKFEGWFRDVGVVVGWEND